MVERLPSVLTLSDLERIPLEDNILWRPIRKRLGITGFGIHAYTGANPGDHVIEPHDETGPASGKHEELYIVMTGEAEFELDGQIFTAAPGTLVFARPEQHRGAKALAADTTVLVLGGKPGTGGPSPFEFWYFAGPAYDAGDYARAYEIAAEGLGVYPEHASLHYNLGCYAALGGETDKALEHLRRAFALNPESREWAKTDSDLDSVRSHLEDDLP